MKIFLRAPHWQIFLLLVAIPWIVDRSLSRTDGEFATTTLLAHSLLALADVGWCWSVGTFLNQIPTPEFRMKTTMFHVSLWHPVIIASLTFITPAGAAPPVEAMLVMISVVFLFLVYLASFIAKALVTAELERPVTFRDYGSTFALFLFFGIGIWFIQPRINRIYEASLIPDAEPQLQS